MAPCSRLCTALLAAELVAFVAGQGAPGGGGGGGFVPSPGFDGSGGGGDLGPGGIILIVAICVIVVVVIVCKAVADDPRPPSSNEYIAEGRSAADAAGRTGFPSGVWRGYYHQFNSRHNVCDFQFNFGSARQTVTGSGVDDVGQYNITGVWGGRRVAFRKQYLSNTPAANGRVNHTMNKGHAVEYRGEKVGPSLGQGIKGQWYIQSSSSGYSGKGTFHLWPGMPDWHQFAPSAPPLAVTALEEMGLPPTQFKVTSDNICTVCFEAPIDACLRPCGHVAVCGACARKLQPPTCPICRSPIVSISRSDGNPFAGASAPLMATPLVDAV